MTKYPIDTNILLRLITDDNPILSPRSREIVKAIEDGNINVFLSEAIFTEVCYVLSNKHGQYGFDHTIIAQYLFDFISFTSVYMHDKSLYRDALTLYSQHAKLDIEDAIISVIASRNKDNKIISFDTYLDNLDNIKRIDSVSAI